MLLSEIAIEYPLLPDFLPRSIWHPTRQDGASASDRPDKRLPQDRASRAIEIGSVASHPQPQPILDRRSPSSQIERLFWHPARPNGDRTSCM